MIQHLYDQQWEMYQNKSHRCDHRIVSINQPYVRPIVRGKVNKLTEFGAKLSVSLTREGVARVDHLRWSAFHEGHDLPSQVEAYRDHHGVYPEVVLGDTIYGSRDNRHYLKARGIRFAGKPLGRPKKVTEENKAELKRLSTQLYSGEARRYVHGLDQQHFPGDESADPAEGFLLALDKVLCAMAVWADVRVEIGVKYWWFCVTHQLTRESSTGVLANS